MTKKRAILRIDIRDKRLARGRLSLSARTRSLVVFRARDALVRSLLEAGRIELLSDLRAGTVRWEAIEAANDAGTLDSIRRNGKVDADLTLGAQTERLLTTVKATKADGTYRQYEIVCRFLVEKFGRNTPITAIRSDALQTWLHEPKETNRAKGNGVARPWSHARQVLAAGIVGRLFNVAIAKEDEAAEAEQRPARIRRNPTKNVELPTSREPRVEFLQPAEWRALQEHIAERPVHALLALGTLAGLRISECAFLRRSDIVGLDTDRPRVRIQPRGGEYPWRPKTKRSIGDVPVCAELRRILLRHIELGYAGDRYLLISRPDRDWPVDRKVLEQWTRRAFTAGGLEYGRKKDALTHHSCRHSFVSWLIQRDVSLKKIELLARTSVTMILKVYGHLMDADLDAAVAIVDEVATGRYPSQLSADGTERQG